jgi:hypothetical protein
MLLGQLMSVKWAKTCQNSHFTGYVVSYVTRIDYRKVYIDNITQHSFTFRGMITDPQEVSVIAVSLSASEMAAADIIHPDDAESADAPKSENQLSTNGLLISVIILSILFVISGLMALYLCCYLKMLKLRRAHGPGTSSKQCVDNLCPENLALDVQKEFEENSCQNRQHDM